MIRMLACAAVVVLLVALPLQAAGISGKYIEARTCDVWTGPCFANAETGLTGHNAVMAWTIDEGTVGGVKLDGLGVAAVIAARDTLGLKQTGPGQAIVIVDERANEAQRQALIELARKQGGELLSHIVKVEKAHVDLTICPCKNNGCATLNAGPAQIETRCIDEKCDKVCGNETAYYPPLAKNVNARAAFAIKHIFTGKGLKETWQDLDRRGAYLGEFHMK
jgi:hypothetical protein